MKRLAVEESEFIPRDVRDVVLYLHSRNPPVAVRFVAAFKATVSLIAGMPRLGRKRMDLGLPEVRSWRVQGFRNYLLFYEITPTRLRLLRVLHGYRDLQAEMV